MTTIERARIAWARAAGNRGHVATLYDAEYGERAAGQVVVTAHGNRMLGGWIDGSTALLSDDLAQQVSDARGRHRERLHLPDAVTAVLDRNGTLRIDFGTAAGFARMSGLFVGDRVVLDDTAAPAVLPDGGAAAVRTALRYAAEDSEITAALTYLLDEDTRWRAAEKVEAECPLWPGTEVTALHTSSESAEVDADFVLTVEAGTEGGTALYVGDERLSRARVAYRHDFWWLIPDEGAPVPLDLGNGHWLISTVEEASSAQVGGMVESDFHIVVARLGPDGSRAILRRSGYIYGLGIIPGAGGLDSWPVYLGGPWPPAPVQPHQSRNRLEENERRRLLRQVDGLVSEIVERAGDAEEDDLLLLLRHLDAHGC